MDHIDAMDQLKQGIGLRAIGNEDPVRAYQIEGFDMFEEMTAGIQEDTVKMLMRVRPHEKLQRKQVARITGVSGGDADSIGGKPQPHVKKEKKVGLSLLLFKLSPTAFRLFARFWFRNHAA